jgi:hypothetical protein
LSYRQSTASPAAAARSHTAVAIHSHECLPERWNTASLNGWRISPSAEQSRRQLQKKRKGASNMKVLNGLAIRRWRGLADDDVPSWNTYLRRMSFSLRNPNERNDMALFRFRHTDRR